MVRLKDRQQDGILSEIRCFNSTMVRLKDSTYRHNPFVSEEFQFHNGSIKSGRRGKLVNLTPQFQFHNGSIKSKQKMQIYANYFFVSIPQWFD